MNERKWIAVKIVGMLTLEQIAGGVLVNESILPSVYDKGLTEYQTFCELKGEKFEPDGDFKQLVIDDITRYLERKGALS